MQQHELFAELEPAGKPGAEVAGFRVEEKLVRVPLSFWKDGRACYDLSAHGGEVVRSRNLSRADELVVEHLREFFHTQNVAREHDQEEAIETIRRQLARVRRLTVPKPRSSNKRPSPADAGADEEPRRYINPFAQDAWRFSKSPDWLSSRREPTATEKRIYSQLLFPMEKKISQGEASIASGKRPCSFVKAGKKISASFLDLIKPRSRKRWE